jgi:hypothetical protein
MTAGDLPSYMTSHPGPLAIEVDANGNGYGVPKLSLLMHAQSNGYDVNLDTHAYSGNYLWFRNFGALKVGAKVKVLAGTQGEKMLSAFNSWREANPHNTARWAGSIGSDPEMFVEKGNGQLLPAFEFLPSKAEVKGKDRIPYWDGFQAEWNIPAGGCLMGFAEYIRQGLMALDIAAKKHRARLSIASVREVEVKHLAEGKEEHIQWGCAPSLNLYNLKGLERSGREVPIRFAGGHIHYGTSFNSTTQRDAVVNALDHILAVSCVSLFANFDNPVRREYYGLPGEYRTPAHGLEYRVLSNAWLMHPVITHLVVDLSRRAFAWGYSGLNKYWKCENTEMISVVQTHDVKGARAILERNKHLLVPLICTMSSYSGSAETAYNVLLNGAESAVKDPRDVYSNWQLGSSHWQGMTSWSAANKAITSNQKV